MADWYGCGVVARSRRGKSARDEEFQEEDIWGVDEEEGEEDLSPKLTFGSSSSASSAWRLPGAPRVSSSSSRGKEKKKKKGEGKTAQQKQESSAPINIPDWSKIYKKKNGGSSASAAAYADNEDAGGDGNNAADNGNLFVYDGYEDDSTLPPHEYIARRLARTQIASYSMCEGVGRTLKGRDLSKVRNAILTKTGFLE